MPPHALIGRWRLVRADPALDFAPGMRMEFLASGRLLYSFDAGPNRPVVSLYYRVEGSILRTEVEGTSHDVTARFEFGPGNVLVLDFGGARAWLLPEVDAHPQGAG